MNMPTTKPQVNNLTRQSLAGLALNDPELLLEGIEARTDWQAKSGLDPKTFALVKIAALIALDGPPSSYQWQIGNALGVGCTPEEISGVLRAIAPQVGGPKVVAAAPEIMIAFGIALPEQAGAGE
jgi:alkylhydroperoxidase/carboxymuconolactone decarboxylase family protein YurZ